MTRLASSLGKGVLRRFVRVRRRGVHFMRAGDGPPVVLLHSALSSAKRELLPLLARLAPDHTVYAFDTLGMGDSDPLPNPDPTAAEAADVLAETLAALKIPPCPVYGSHTGGSVGVELARRHPKQVTALVVNGVTIFNAREKAYLLSDEYRPHFTVADDGSHLTASWVKARDSSMWFPWSRRNAANRRPYPFPSPDGVHEAFLDRMRAGNNYRAVYGASLGHDGREAIAALDLPATFMAYTADPLYSHFDRLAKLKPNQHIGRYEYDVPAYDDAREQVMRGYRVDAKAPPELPFRPTPGAVNRRYVDLPGGQVLVRSCGEARNGRPLVLLHDGRGSSRMLEPLLRVLGRARPVYAPDIPDNGASDPLAARRPAVADYTDAVAAAIAGLELDGYDVYAVGASAAVALELAQRTKARVVLEAPDFYATAFARRLARDWVPPLEPQWDGSHLNRLWLMLRDEYAFWPWFDKSPAAACAVDAPTDWIELHARVVDILRSLATYHRLTAAALRYDWEPALRAARKQVTLAAETSDPRRPHAEAAARQARTGDVVTVPRAPTAKAKALLGLTA